MIQYEQQQEARESSRKRKLINIHRKLTCSVTGGEGLATSKKTGISLSLAYFSFSDFSRKGTLKAIYLN